MLCIKSIETEEVKLMLGVSLIIIAAAIVYMVETYISTYYTIEYMHGTSLFLILLAKYGTPVLFLLLCAYIAYRKFLKKQKAAASAASERPTSKEELYTNKIQTAVKTKSVFSEQADQMLYQVRRFGQKMAVAYSMTQDSKTSGEQAKCLTLLESAERIFYDRLDDAIRSASMFDETEYKAFWRSGNMLVGNGTVVSYQCRSMDEAVDMVAALYNGKKAEATQA